jgi:catechol 2,3-dioxygenase-like lactoylglutathione lyase family enzyme
VSTRSAARRAGVRHPVVGVVDVEYWGLAAAPAGGRVFEFAGARRSTMPGPTRLHHVAFATRDVEATYDFYARRLGMRLLHTENHKVGRGWMRHFFFDMGGGECMAFFEFENVGEKDGYRTDVSTGAGLPVWVNHVAFNVDGLDALAAMKRRCEEHDVELLMETDHGWCQSIYMVDPNGIMVEFTTTTRPEAFSQSEEEALRLLRLSPDQFTEGDRKDASNAVKLNREAAAKVTVTEPRR